MDKNYIKDCLKDAGCSNEEIEQCLCDKHKIHTLRARQLELVHKEQDRLACIDTLCHEMKKEKNNGNHKG